VGQKIAFLIDVHGRRIPSFTLRDYCLFVLFFPQLIAGPIVHYREMMPQFQTAQCRWDKLDIAVGLSLFVFGLFKKVVLADGISEYVSPVYETATSGSEITLFPAWNAAIGFTLQIYFDFSGYSDMALGLARFFGVRLPANFDSPLKATNIIDFWLRWHMTLTRFLTAYLYNLLVLWLTRRRMAKRLPGIGGRASSVGAFFQLPAGRRCSPCSCRGCGTGRVIFSSHGGCCMASICRLTTHGAYSGQGTGQTRKPMIGSCGRRGLCSHSCRLLLRWFSFDPRMWAPPKSCCRAWLA